jgi:hypothetical protein
MWACKQESGPTVFELKDVEELVAEALLTFLYTWNYADFVNGGGATAATFDTPGGDNVFEQAMFNIKVYMAAAKYGMPELQQQAAQVFGSSLFRASSATAPPPTLGDESGRGLTSGISNSSSSGGSGGARLTPQALTEIIDEVYNCVSSVLPHDRLLRDIVGYVMSHEMTALLQHRSFVALLDRSGGSCGIAADAARLLAARVGPAQTRYSCPRCRGEFETVLPARTFFKCYHCSFATDSEKWAACVVPPDFAAKWREQHGGQK